MGHSLIVSDHPARRQNKVSARSRDISVRLTMRLHSDVPRVKAASSTHSMRVPAAQPEHPAPSWGTQPALLNAGVGDALHDLSLEQ